MRENRLKQLFARNEAALGAWAGFASPPAIEALCRLDFDWILLDGEHGMASLDNGLPLLHAMKGERPTALVRVPSPDPITIAHWLDLGVEGVLLPRVRSVEEVEAAVAATRYPPTGTRGIGPFRASGWFTAFPDYYAGIHEQLLVLAQVETREAVESLEAIAAVDGLDGLFIGPADLSAALGHFPETRHPEVEKVVERVLEVADAHGKAAGYYCESGEAARERLEQGFGMVSVCSDIGALVSGAGRQLRRARGKDEASGGSGPVAV